MKRRRPGRVNSIALKKYPERSCSVCGRKDRKHKLIRIALFSPEMRMELDLSGVLGGRGVYICTSRMCAVNFIKLVRKGKIRNTGKVSAGSRDRLIESLQGNELWLEKNEGSGEWPE